MNNSSHGKPSLDGLTLRRRVSTPTGVGKTTASGPSSVPQQYLRPTHKQATSTASQAPEILPRPELVKNNGLKRSEIDDSLRAVDETPVKKQKKTRKIFTKKRLMLLIVLLLVVGIGYMVTKFVLASGRVFSGNLFDLLGSGVELKKDADGRTNILVFGTSEDDPGHGGAALTDSIMLVSLHQEKKTAAMVSMPRDMWVSFGKACNAGYSGKINELYACNATNGDVAAGAKALQDKVGEVFGFTEVQYFVKVNYTVVRQLTTALGGVTVNVEGAFGAKGIYDSGMGNLLRLPNGPATMQGEQALAFVRARGEGYGSYGLNGNFSREQNQQKMIMAIREKALSAGTLANPAAVIQIMDALGDNVRTNFSAAEVKTLANLGKEIVADQIVRVNLIDEKNPVVQTGTSPTGLSIVRPIAGLSNYTKLQAYIRAQIEGGSVESEDATIQILNGSAKTGAATTQKTKLSEAGLINIVVGDTTYRPTSSLVWYDVSAGANPKTQAKLASVLGKQPAGTKLPAGVQSTADFVILLGNE